MEPSLDTWTVVFLVAAVQGLFLSLMIFLRKSKVNNLLGTLILVFSIMLLFYVAFWTHYTTQLPSFVGALQGLTFTFGPLLYFYVRTDKKAFYFNVWHFIPLALYLIHFINWPNYPVENRPTIATVVSSLQTIHLIFYTILILHFVNKNKGLYNGALKLYAWRKKVAWAFTGYTLSFLTYFILVWTNTLALEYDYMISVASSFFIYFIGYHGFHKQEIFKMYENGRYDKSLLPQIAANSILSKLKLMMTAEKLFLDNAISLNSLAEKVSLSPHHISQVINGLEQKNFADFINEYRIEEAKTLLLETNNKIIHIAYDCGFNTKTSFNSAFKKFTGMPPSAFRESKVVMT